MHHRVIRAFDDYIPIGAVAFSSTELQEVLGRCDQLAVHAVIEDVVTNGRFDLFVETSADGKNWIQRNGQATTFGNGDITLASITTGGTPYESMWSDGALQRSAFTNASGPLMPYVRFRIQLGGGSGHVAVLATLRDL